MEIKNELVPLAYELSKKVYEGQMKFTEAKLELSKDGQMKDSSAADYISNFKHLLNGKRFTRSLNAFSLEYFLDRIYTEYGIIGLSNAILALEQHIDYYEPTRKTTLKTLRHILAKYTSLALTVDPDEKEQNDIIRELVKQGKSKEDVLKELREMQEKETEEVQISYTAYKRDNVTIAKIKYAKEAFCQICGCTILKKDGSFYIEAAHINPKKEKGQELLHNILLLCPNHHKEFDLGHRKIISHDKERVEFELNGVPYTIVF